MEEKKPSDEVRVGGLQLANRFVFAPVKTSLAAVGGNPGEESERFYARIAAGGTALVTLEPAAVDRLALEHPRQLRLFDDSHTEAMARLVAAVHDNGSKAMVHLNHPGRAANPKAIGTQPVSPSAMSCPATGATARELTVEEIAGIPDQFASATIRAVMAGADAIEVQFGHGYLLGQFFSPRTNKRRDEWGNTPAGRLRLPRLVLQRVLAAAGSLPVVVRISGSEFVDGGLTPETMAPLLEMFERHQVAALHVGMGNACDNPPWYFHHMSLPLPAQEQVLAEIRGLTKLKLIAVGRLGNPERIRNILRQNLADLVALARPLLADPSFVNKLLSGREDDIALCGACLQTCLPRVKQAQPITCALNPWTVQDNVTKADSARKVLVIGGGPAGIGAALGAAERVHQVELIEEHDVLGGQFALAVKAPGKQMMATMLASLIRRVARAGVKVTTGIKADADLIIKRTPDVVVLAHGPRPRIPDIPGIHDQHLLTGVEYFEDPGRVEGERVLVIGAGMVGMEAAEQLLQTGHQVVATKRGEEIAPDMDPLSRALMNKRLAGQDRLQVMTGTTVLAFEADKVRLRNQDGEIFLEPFDTVISAAGMEPDESLLSQLQDQSFQTLLVGDAHEPASIEQAFAEGLQTGRTI